MNDMSLDTMLPEPATLDEFELDAISGGASPAAIVATAALVGGLAALGKAVYDYVDRHTPEAKVISF